MVPVANRSTLRAALESTHGTVTNFLEQLVGESVDAQVHRHQTVAAPTSNDLEVAGGEPLLQRAATLRGRRTGSPYVYAESVIVTNRLPTRFYQLLESSIDPIGRILNEIGIATTRKDLVGPGGLGPSRFEGAINDGDVVFVRTYRIDSEQTPLMVITEWFLKTLNPFLMSA